MNWQPIETAPKDGTSILGLCGVIVEKVAWFDGWGKGVVTKAQGPCWGIAYRNGENMYDEGWDTGTGAYFVPDDQPTLWMPLPDGPQNEDTHSGQEAEIYFQFA